MRSNVDHPNDIHFKRHSINSNKQNNKQADSAKIWEVKVHVRDLAAARYHRQDGAEVGEDNQASDRNHRRDASRGQLQHNSAHTTPVSAATTAAAATITAAAITTTAA